MPEQTQEAVNWALKQEVEGRYGQVYYASEVPYLLVDFTRQYFNEHNIEYDTFSYDDLKPYLSKI